jgi:hypothetical protein
MLRRRERHASSSRLLGLIVLVALATLLLQGATVPHTHAGVGPGLYNQDHDLALLATLHGAAVLHDAPAAPLVLGGGSAPAPPSRGAPTSPPQSNAASRAPPRV